MIALAATAIFCVLADEGPIPVFWVNSYDACLVLLNSSMADASCSEVEEGDE